MNFEMVLDIIICALICIWAFIPAFMTIKGSRLNNKLKTLMSFSSKTDNVRNEHDISAGFHENIIVGSDVLDVQIVSEYWRHYTSYKLQVIGRASNDEVIDIVEYIHNSINGETLKYIKISNKREAKAIINCVFRTLDARDKNRKINVSKLNRKHKVEVLNAKN